MKALTGFAAASVFVALLNVAHTATAALKPSDLRCEYLKDPLGIDAAQPRLSWVLQLEKASARAQRQTAFQVLVASSRRTLESNHGDLWDSGKTDSDQSIQLKYAGSPLRSEQECFWKVRVWDQDGHVSNWSEPAHWSMGLLAATDWKAHWIGRDEAEPKSSLTNCFWIWFPEGHAEKSAPVGTRYFPTMSMTARPTMHGWKCRVGANPGLVIATGSKPSWWAAETALP